MARRITVLLALLVVVAPLQGCLSGDLPFVGGDDGDTPDGSDGADGGTDGGDDGTDGTDGGDEELPPIPKALFNGTLAYRHVHDQVTFDRNGTRQYRIPGTEGAKAARRDIVDVLGGHGWQIHTQFWNGVYVCEETRLANIVGTLPGRTNKQIILGAHYDTRPWSEEDENFSQRKRPTLGANDGGSGVGALLELGRVLAKHHPLNHTIKMVFFDAEDGGSPPPYLRPDCNPDEDERHKTPGGWIIGSSHYVAEMGQEARNRTEAVVILDLVGDENLTLQRERYSHREPHRDLQDRIWSHAADLNYTQFEERLGGQVLDDHRPFQRVGIKAVDIIHQDQNGSTVFPDTWHTLNDTLEHVSPESLEAVGRVTERTVYDLDRELGRPE